MGDYLTEEDREALVTALAAPDPDRAPITEIQVMFVLAVVEKVVARHVTEALTAAAKEVHLHMGRDADYDDGMEDAAEIVRNYGKAES